MRVTTELHGGIGFTWEYDLHLWFRRASKHVFTEGAQPSSRAGNDAAHARRAVIALHGEYVRVRAPRASSLTRGYGRQIVSMRW